MQKLQIFQTTLAFENVAAGRKDISNTELNELVLDRLNKGIAVFTFIKADGSQRMAIGTLNPELIRTPKEKEIIEKVLHNAADLVEFVSNTTEDSRKKTFLNNLVNRIACLGIILKSDKPAKSRTPSVTSQTFFDLQAQDWKAYTKANILALIDI